MEQQHKFDSLPGYALGILNEIETKEVDEHLSRCQLCRNELESYKNVIEELPMAIQTSQPPASLKSSLMNRVQGEKQILSQPEHISTWEKLRRSFIATAPIWGVVSLVLVLILVLSNLLLWQRVDNLSDSQQHLVTVSLQGTEAIPQAVGMLVMSEDGDYGVLVVDGLPDLSERQQYQLWLIEDGQRTSGGVFSVNEDGYGSIVLSVDQALTTFSAFGITIEPAGGSPGPTGIKVLGGENL